MAILLPGQKAPDFRLQDQYGIEHCLSHYRGLWVILCFLPNDYNAACVKQVRAVRDVFGLMQDRYTEVFGINMDAKKGLVRFAERQKLNFPMLSDHSGQVCENFDTLWSLGPVKIVRRNSIIINPTGDVVRIYRRARPHHHGKQLIDDLNLLQQTFIPEQKASLA